MGNLRKLERNVVKCHAIKNNKDFDVAWDEYREKKYVKKDTEGKVLTDNTPRSNQKKKQNHFDNKRQYFNMFAWFANIRSERDKKKEEKVDVVEELMRTSDKETCQ